MTEQGDETDLIQQFSDLMDDNREVYSARLAAHFGHLDEELLTKVMNVTRYAMLLDQSDRLRDLLGEAQIVVPGDNEISREQIDTLTGAYAFNREHWDKKIDLWLARNKPN